MLEDAWICNEESQGPKILKWKVRKAIQDHRERKSIDFDIIINNIFNNTRVKIQSRDPARHVSNGSLMNGFGQFYINLIMVLSLIHI